MNTLETVSKLPPKLERISQTIESQKNTNSSLFVEWTNLAGKIDFVSDTLQRELADPSIKGKMGLNYLGSTVCKSILELVNTSIETISTLAKKEVIRDINLTELSKIKVDIEALQLEINKLAPQPSSTERIKIIQEFLELTSKIKIVADTLPALNHEEIDKNTSRIDTITTKISQKRDKLKAEREALEEATKPQETKERITSLDQLAPDKLTQKEMVKMHTVLTTIDPRTSRTSGISQTATIKLLPYFHIIKSGNLNRLDFKDKHVFVDGKKIDVDNASVTTKSKCKNFDDIVTKGKSPNDLLQILYDKCFPPSSQEGISTSARVVETSNALPLKLKETKTPSELREQRLTEYKQKGIWNGLAPNITTIPIEELKERSQKLVDKMNQDYQASTSYAGGAENAFELAFKGLSLAETNIQSIHFMPNGSKGDSIGGDFIVVAKSGRQYCFDAKTKNAMNSQKVERNSRVWKNCALHPVYTNDELNIKSTQQMVLDLVAFAESQQ